MDAALQLSAAAWGRHYGCVGAGWTRWKRRRGGAAWRLHGATVVTRTSGAQEVLEMLRLIWLFEIILIIIEEKDKNTLTYQESVPWPSLMEVFVSH